METPDFEHGIVYFKQFGTERVKQIIRLTDNIYPDTDASLVIQGPLP